MFPFRNPGAGHAAATLVLFLIFSACSGNEGRPTSRVSSDAAAARAIRATLAADEEAGSRRNHAPESVPLDQAIQDYVNELESLDYEATPPDFAEAFRAHLEAWRSSLEFFAEYDELRGEMHELFERIRALGPTPREELEAVEARIWGTWEEVEASARRHGAISPRSD